MVVVRLQGGLGNQMFQYAFGYALSRENGLPLKVDVGLLEDARSNPLAVQRNLEIEVFNLGLSFVNRIEQLWLAPRKTATLLEKLSTKVLRMARSYESRIQKGHSFDNALRRKVSTTCCIVGRWQSYRYFESFQDEVRDLFAPEKLHPSASARDVLSQLNDELAVGVHVRRGDYVTHPVYSRSIGALSIGYYETAFERLKDKYTGRKVNFIVVSDDLEWCKKAWSGLDGFHFISDSNPFSDLWLLTQTDAVIISNSTFGWWGGFLGDVDRMVIAPNVWAKEPAYIPQDLIPSNWVQINNQFEGSN